MAVLVLLNQIILILPKLNFHNQPNLSQWIAQTKCPSPDGSIRVVPNPTVCHSAQICFLKGTKFLQTFWSSVNLIYFILSEVFLTDTFYYYANVNYMLI